MNTKTDERIQHILFISVILFVGLIGLMLGQINTIERLHSMENNLSIAQEVMEAGVR